MVLCVTLQMHCLDGNALPDHLGDATLSGAHMYPVPMYEGVAYLSFKRLTTSLSSGYLGTTQISLKAMVGSFWKGLAAQRIISADRQTDRHLTSSQVSCTVV